MNVFQLNFAHAALVLPLAFAAFACESTPEDDMSVEVNGSRTAFTQELVVERNIVTDAIEIVGVSKEGHTITIELVSEGTGVFTEKDYDSEAGLLAPQYNVVYEDEKENVYHFDGGLGENGSFRVDIAEFEGHSGGVVSGTFEGELPGNAFNGDGAIDHVSLVGGSFSVTVDESL